MAGAKIPRESHRYSGLTSIHANISVVEPKPPDDPDSALAYSMEGSSNQPPGALQPFFWSPGWNSIQAVNKFQSEIGDALTGGDPGVRLFEPSQKGVYFTSIPAAFARREAEWLIVPIEHIFGSDELSFQSPAVASLAPAPYLALNAADAASLHMEEQAGEVEIELGGAKHRLPLKVLPDLPAGIAGIPAGLTTARWSGASGLAPDLASIMTSPHPIAAIVGILLVVLSLSAMLIWVERRLLALWQDRYGPNRVGPFGLLQVLADMIKIFTKEDWIPPFADKVVFVIAPMIVMVTVLLSFAVVPFAPGIIVADLNVALLFFLGMSSLGVYSIVLAGWASDSKYSLLGGLRAAAQMISYEVFMSLSLMGVVLLAGSFSLTAIVEAQKRLWFVVPQFLGFVLFLIAGVAEARRLPFDLPEAEAELVAGFHSEYSGMKFGMFFVGEYLGLILISSMITVLFFGGWLGPWLPPIVWFAIKVLAFICFFILLRASLPRLRFDQLMSWGWKTMLPLALVNLLVTGAIVVAWKR